jgi:hypothetical protein
MKKTTYIKATILSLTAAVLLLSSCLKDSRYVNYGAVGTLVELPLAEVNDYALAPPNGILQLPTYTATDAQDTLTVAVNVASPKPLTSSLAVTLSLTDTTVMHANTPDTYKLLPSSDYSVIGGLTVTVPANQRLAYLRVLIKPSAIGLVNSGVYALPVTIESASGQPIAQPYKGLIYEIDLK